MGIVNVTPDSFYDGGRFASVEAAVDHAWRLVEEGADIVDVGGQSTRPGAREVPEEEEIRRILPVVRALVGRLSVPISVDTMRARVAHQAMEAGAHIINDVSAMTRDPDMVRVAHDTGAGVILMHMQGRPETMQIAPQYEDVVREVRAYLADRLEAVSAAGVARECLAVDPGIGFGKTVEHNLELLAHLEEMISLGRPVVIGVSRKSFLGHLTGRSVEERLPASLAALAWCVDRGVHVIRVHDVAASKDAASVIQALRQRRGN